MRLVKVAVLGGTGVGKSSIIRQFVWNEFTKEHIPTVTKESYYPSIVLNDHLYELKIVDIPVIPYFPSNTYYEWTDFRTYGLRSATAYVLVFDLNAPETFQYVKTIRDQMYDSRNMQNVPVVVAGNKFDLCEPRDRREAANLVKKHWKCGYVECSAKHNWHILHLFKEVMKAVEVTEYGQKLPSYAPRFEGLHVDRERDKCVLM